MFGDFGFSELLLILVIGIIIVGPKDIPTIMRKTCGYYYKILALKDHMEDQLKSNLEGMVGQDFLEDLEKQEYKINTDIKTSMNKILSQERKKLKNNFK